LVFALSNGRECKCTPAKVHSDRHIKRAKVPGNESSIELSFPGAKRPGSERARKRIGQGARTPGSESSRERNGQGPIGRSRGRKGSVLQIWQQLGNVNINKLWPSLDHIFSASWNRGVTQTLMSYHGVSFTCAKRLLVELHCTLHIKQTVIILYGKQCFQWLPKCSQSYLWLRLEAVCRNIASD